MTTRTISVRPRDIQSIIDATFPDYRGPHAKVRIQPTASYNAADLCWSGGSRTEVVALHVNPDGSLVTKALETVSPWSGQSWGGNIPAWIMLVEHCIFQGKDLGIRCIISPDSQYMPKLTLPAVVELSRDEVIVLSAHAQLKGGKYRDEAYERAQSGGYHYGPGPAPPKAFQAQPVEQVAQALAARGYLKINKAGASSITIEGRNALESLPAERAVRL